MQPLGHGFVLAPATSSGVAAPHHFPERNVGGEGSDHDYTHRLLTGGEPVAMGLSPASTDPAGTSPAAPF
jgi:hypothetical protein